MYFEWYKKLVYAGTRWARNILTILSPARLTTLGQDIDIVRYFLVIVIFYCANTIAFHMLG